MWIGIGWQHHFRDYEGIASRKGKKGAVITLLPDGHDKPFQTHQIAGKDVGMISILDIKLMASIRATATLI